MGIKFCSRLTSLTFLLCDVFNMYVSSTYLRVKNAEKFCQASVKRFKILQAVKVGEFCAGTCLQAWVQYYLYCQIQINQTDTDTDTDYALQTDAESWKEAGVFPHGVCSSAEILCIIHIFSLTISMISCRANQGIWGCKQSKSTRDISQDPNCIPNGCRTTIFINKYRTSLLKKMVDRALNSVDYANRA
jgi:hypothetical protein